MAKLEEELKGTDAPLAARFHLAAAMLAAGQTEAADEFVGNAGPPTTHQRDEACLNSAVREAAIMLMVLLDVDPESPRVPALAEQLRRSARIGRWGTTQENSFALMALGKYARRLGRAGDCTGTVALSDGSVRSFTSKEGLSLADLEAGRPVLVDVEGEGKVWAFWGTEGVPPGVRVTEEDMGLKVRRAILDMEGRPVQATALTQGELYRVKIALGSSVPQENLVVADLLPAGLEIEDPGLAGAARLGTQETREGWQVRHVERRDDRMLIFGDLSRGRGEYTYVVRAVTAGTFVLPAIEAACMYDPGAYSVNGAGNLEIKP
jgi:hypothetical protein